MGNALTVMAKKQSSRNPLEEDTSMRRTPRYQPLGRARIVTLSYGLDSQKREAEIVDESTTGMGIRLREIPGLTVGQTVAIEGKRGKISATVVRIEPAKEGGFGVGLLYGNSRKP